MHTRRVSQVTIYSQQVRALNLICALDREAPLRGKHLVVIGAGIAGATAAAAAALCEARVTLLERAEEIMHMQRGCHSRYIHPNIRDWPEGSYVPASAHLPVLGWSVGTAHDVAERLAAQFDRISRVLARGRGPGSLEVHTRVTAEVLPSRRGVRWTPVDGGRCRSIRSARAIILACGFGVETSIHGAPRTSYWRVDALTQSPLFSRAEKHELVVVGDGDGGITDVIRAKLKNFDHGSFLDGCIQALESVRPEVQKIEKVAREKEAAIRKRPERDSIIAEQCSRFLAARYTALPKRALTLLDRAMGERRRGTRVTWITPGPALSLKTQPLHRLLVWRLLVRREIEQIRGRALYAHPYGDQYLLAVSDEPQPGVVGSRRIRIVADDVVARAGARHTFATGAERAAKAAMGMAKIFDELGQLENEPPFEPLGEDVRHYFADRVDRIKVSAVDGAHRAGIRLKARVMSGRYAWDQKRIVYTVRIWLEGCPKHIRWVDYDLHPEYGVVTRRAGRVPNFEHWLNSSDDYWIRVRLSDGFETGEWLTIAIETTGERPDARVVKELRKNAQAMRHDRGYRSRSWLSIVDAAAWMRENKMKGASPDYGGFTPVLPPLDEPRSGQGSASQRGFIRRPAPIRGAGALPERKRTRRRWR